MSYTKAILDVQLFDVEDVITTSPLVPEPQPEPAPQPQPEPAPQPAPQPETPDVPFYEEDDV